MYWIHHDILQVPSGLNTTLKFHVADVEFRDAMHFPGATPKDDVPFGPVTLYKAERVGPNERIGSWPLQGAPDFLMVYECFFSARSPALPLLKFSN
jgi:hypothetical protein